MTFLQKYLPENKVLRFAVIAFIIIIILFIIQYVSSQYVESLENLPGSDMIAVPAEYTTQMPVTEAPITTAIPSTSVFSHKPSESDSNGLGSAVNFSQSGEITPTDLLPKSGAAAEFDSQFPVGAGDLTAKNFLSAGHHIGINTVSGSQKNANYQLRADPYIEPRHVTPFNQSTMLPDMSRKDIVIGQ